MRLDQLKDMMETDARKRVTAQEQTIKELHQKTSEQSTTIKALENRCLALSGGTLCGKCLHEAACTAREKVRAKA